MRAGRPPTVTVPGVVPRYFPQTVTMAPSWSAICPGWELSLLPVAGPETRSVKRMTGGWTACALTMQVTIDTDSIIAARTKFLDRVVTLLLPLRTSAG